MSPDVKTAESTVYPPVKYDVHDLFTWICFDSTNGRIPFSKLLYECSISFRKLIHYVRLSGVANKIGVDHKGYSSAHNSVKIQVITYWIPWIVVLTRKVRWQLIFRQIISSNHVYIPTSTPQHIVSPFHVSNSFISVVTGWKVLRHKHIYKCAVGCKSKDSIHWWSVNIS